MSILSGPPSATGGTLVNSMVGPRTLGLEQPISTKTKKNKNANTCGRAGQAKGKRGNRRVLGLITKKRPNTNGKRRGGEHLPPKKGHTFKEWRAKSLPLFL